MLGHIQGIMGLAVTCGPRTGLPLDLLRQLSMTCYEARRSSSLELPNKSPTNTRHSHRR
jgi:hypothetical protein